MQLTPCVGGVLLPKKRGILCKKNQDCRGSLQITGGLLHACNCGRCLWVPGSASQGRMCVGPRVWFTEHLEVEQLFACSMQDMPLMPELQSAACSMRNMQLMHVLRNIASFMQNATVACSLQNWMRSFLGTPRHVSQEKLREVLRSFQDGIEPWPSITEPRLFQRVAKPPGHTCVKMPVLPKAAGIVPWKLLRDALSARRAGNIPSREGRSPLHGKT